MSVDETEQKTIKVRFNVYNWRFMDQRPYVRELQITYDSEASIIEKINGFVEDDTDKKHYHLTGIHQLNDGIKNVVSYTKEGYKLLTLDISAIDIGKELHIVYTDVTGGKREKENMIRNDDERRRWRRLYK